VRGAPGNRRPYRDPGTLCLSPAPGALPKRSLQKLLSSGTKANFRFLLIVLLENAADPFEDVPGFLADLLARLARLLADVADGGANVSQ